MDEDLQQELREALLVFRTGVQFAVTVSCFAVGTSMGAMLVSSSRLAGTFWGLGLALLIGLIAGAMASYSMFRAESRKTQPVQDQNRQNSTGHTANYTHQ